MTAHYMLPVCCAVKVTAAPVCNLADLWHGKHINYRRREWDKLGPIFPANRSGTPLVYRLTENRTYRQIVEEYLNIAGQKNWLDTELERILIMSRSVYSPLQVDQLLRMTDNSKKTGLSTKLRVNIFPVFDGNSVYWVTTHRGAGVHQMYGWGVDLEPFRGSCLWRDWDDHVTFLYADGFTPDETEQKHTIFNWLSRLLKR